MFLTTIDFDGEYQFASNDSVNLDTIIDDYERKVYELILGSSEYNKLVDDLSGGVPTSQKFQRLVNGGNTYTVTDQNNTEITYKWVGMENVVKGYIFYHVSEAQKSSNTDFGNKGLESETGAEDVGDSKAINAYRESAVMIGDDLRNYTSDFNVGIVSVSGYPTDCKNYKWYWQAKLKNTFFSYMLANITDFPTWMFEQIKYPTI